MAAKKIKSGDYDIVVLDEIIYALQEDLLKIEDLLSLIKIKPSHVDLIFTGRGAPKELIDKADLVTEMKEIKHPFQKGHFAKRGIDY